MQTTTEPLISREVMELEFQRFADLMDLDLDPKNSDESESLEQTKRVLFRAMATGALTFDERGVPTYKTSTGDSLTFPEPTGSVLIAMDGSGKKDLGPAHRFALAFAELTGKPQHYFAKLPQRDIRVVQRIVQLFLV